MAKCTTYLREFVQDTARAIADGAVATTASSLFNQSTTALRRNSVAKRRVRYRYILVFLNP